MMAAGPGRVPRIVLLGRQNVGKSTLLNRLAGRRVAIAHQTPGVTRDRVEVPVRWGGRSLVAVDTGGYAQGVRGVEASVAAQAERALASADVVLLVVDAVTGVQEEDASLARRLRRSNVPVLVVANKVDGERLEAATFEFHKLGLGTPVPVSALHGRGSAELLDLILDLVPEEGEPEVEPEARIAIVGRPNVGKSSLFNRLVREERAVVHDLPGTTRDTVDSVVEVEGRSVRFVDTAGLRRAIKTQAVEYYGLIRSLRAIGQSDVAALVVDAVAGLTGEDKRIGARVVEAGRGLVVVLNKWDLVPTGDRAARFAELAEVARLFPGTPVVRCSALTGMGTRRVVPALLAVHDAWARRVPTAEVNRVLQAAVAAHPPPRTAGRIRYGTEVAARPPSFVLFGTRDAGAAYRRYLERMLRDAFGLDGVPVRLTFRAGGRRPSRRGK